MAALLFSLIAGAPLAAPAEGPAEVRFVDESVRTGRVLSLDATDLVLQEDTRATPRLIPLAEVRAIAWADGRVDAYAPIENPDVDGTGHGGSAIRSGPWVSRDDLVLTRGESAWRSVPRGIVIGTLATLFVDGADQKKLAFVAGFGLQFGVSLAMGW